MNENLKLRMATADDCEIAQHYSGVLGEYQKMAPEKLTITKERMREMLMDRSLEAVLAEIDGKPVGIGLFYLMPSGFSGKTVMFLHIFYVEPTLQKSGVGRAIMKYLSQICIDRNYERMEWLCLDWNETAKDFYYGIGSDEIDIVKTFRLSPAQMQALIDG